MLPIHRRSLGGGSYICVQPTECGTTGDMDVLVCVFQARVAGHSLGSMSPMCPHIPCCLLSVPLTLNLQQKSEMLGLCLRSSLTSFQPRVSSHPPNTHLWPKPL
jgi:hypothetical protein